MPVTPQYKWEESETLVTVTVSTKGVPAARVDVYTTPSFLKVNAGQFLLAVDLHQDVVHEKTTYRHVAEENALVVVFTKAQPNVVWGQLQATGDKKALYDRRQASMNLAQQSLHNSFQLRQKTKESEEKRYFHQSWDLEKQQRAQIEARVKEERDTEEAQLEQWQADTEEGITITRKADSTIATATTSSSSSSSAIWFFREISLI